MMETLVIDKERTKMIAHRGLSGLEAENTAASFIAAGNKTYYGIECDIHKTKDNEYVVIHDDNTKRVSNINKVIKDCAYDELKELNLFELDQKITKSYLKIPTLREYLEICIKYKKVCVIEFKNLFNKHDISEVLSIVQSYKYLDRCIFISFYVENLIAARLINQTIKLQYLVTKVEEDTIDICKKYHFDIDIEHTSLTRELLLEIQKNNILVNAWTIDNPIVALMLIGWGIDYITTNILE